MKKILTIVGFILISNQSAIAKEITICSGKDNGTEFNCVGDYTNTKTNLVALYRHGWRLIALKAYDLGTAMFYLEK